MTPQTFIHPLFVSVSVSVLDVYSTSCSKFRSGICCTQSSFFGIVVRDCGGVVLVNLLVGRLRLNCGLAGRGCVVWFFGGI